MSQEEAVRRILREVEEGLSGASERLFEVVYAELKLLGSRSLRGGTG